MSFPFYKKKEFQSRLKRNKEIYLGDIILNFDKMKNKKNHKNFKLEFDKLWIHGFVHLFGYDHKKEKIFTLCKKLKKNIYRLLKIIEKFLNNRLFTLFLFPFLIGSLTVFLFNPII